MKKLKVMSMLALSALLMTGCGDAMPELTSEQSDMISEYAAGLLLKYSPNYNYKIVSEDELEVALAAMQPIEEEQTQEQPEIETSETPETEAEQPQDTSGNETEEGVTETDLADSDTVVQNIDDDLASLLGIEDVTLKYNSYEICDSYPKNNSGFTVSAAQGRKLLVVHFDLENSTGEKINCSLFDYSLKVRFTLNESSTVSALSTMLPNEMMSYMDSLDSGGTDDVVAVAEISDSYTDDLTGLSIQITSDTGKVDVRAK